MSIAAGLLMYAALLSWLSPRVLTRITTRGINPQLGAVTWLTTIGCAIGAWMAAVVVLIHDAVVTLFGGPVWTVCLKLLGHVGQIDLARPVAATVTIALTGSALTASTLAARHIGRTLRRLHSRSNQHAKAARVVGSPTPWRDVVLVQAEQPAAYCVAGRPRAIVVTTAALASLEDDQLAAVLAHEQAHLAGRHHQVLMLLRAVAAALPRLPLMAAGPAAVARLLEMCADDTAARRCGPHPLLCGLMTLVGGRAVPSAALGAAGTAVLDRASRLATPAPRGARWRDRIRLGATISLTIAVPLFTGVLCHH